MYEPIKSLRPKLNTVGRRKIHRYNLCFCPTSMTYRILSPKASTQKSEGLILIGKFGSRRACALAQDDLPEVPKGHDQERIRKRWIRNLKKWLHYPKKNMSITLSNPNQGSSILIQIKNDSYIGYRAKDNNDETFYSRDEYGDQKRLICRFLRTSQSDRGRTLK